MALDRSPDFFSFHFSHTRQNSPAPWRPCFSIEGHQRNISTKLFENWPSCLGEEFFFRLVAMKRRILHGFQKFK